MKIYYFAVYIINKHSLCQENRVKEKMMNMELRSAINMGGHVERQKGLWRGKILVPNKHCKVG